MSHHFVVVAIHGPMRVTEHGRDDRGHFTHVEGEHVLNGGETFSGIAHAGNRYTIEHVGDHVHD